ncbi:MAG: endolytic transglycosylase MltG [Clostridia bacterium]|nr:endolytic transglycosylase MltG [Clostridia bacterium]
MDDEKMTGLDDVSSDISKKINDIVLEEEMAAARRERQQKAAGFRLNLNLDDEFGDLLPQKPTSSEKSGQTTAILTEVIEKASRSTEADPSAAAEPTEPAATAPKWDAPVRITDEPDIPDEPEEPHAPHKKKSGKYSQVRGCLHVAIYIMVVVAVSSVLAYFIVAGALDMLGFNKSAAKVDVTVPEGATIKEIAEILDENDLISQPLIFRLFAKVTHADESFQAGVFTLSANQGYQGLIASLQTVEREEVSIMFREGLNIREVADLLEKNGVCSAEEFLEETETGDFSDYDFVPGIPKTGTGSDHPYRIYRLEGYLFPDTYTFYTNSSPHTAVCKFLDGFEMRVDTKLRTAIKAEGMTLDDAIILASMLEQEADNSEDMVKVARVFLNRLDEPDEFPHLQSDATAKYVGSIISGMGKNSPTAQAYNTYVCTGLPTGPICNPGLKTLRSVVYPSEDPDIVNCYYFATDTSVDPSVTYYSETYDQHVAICNEHGLGIHGEEE